MANDIYDIDGGCKAAAYILNTPVREVDCDNCPFPFCVIAEGNLLQYELRKKLTKTMHQLGSTINEMAVAIGVTPRTAYRYMEREESKKMKDGKTVKAISCPLCNMIHSPSVMCQSSTYTVVKVREQYTIITNKHGKTSIREERLVETFMDYVFPSSRYTGKSSEGHSFWDLDNVDNKEAKDFGTMCDALNKYMINVVGGEKCQVQVQ